MKKIILITLGVAAAAGIGYLLYNKFVAKAAATDPLAGKPLVAKPNILVKVKNAETQIGDEAQPIRVTGSTY
ncbi:MAG: hypothetical protein UV51_C0007G0030 [Candidatus Woesebacteria bacterium GW2011_GWC1_42_9]|nr:MAG: hypothetical protein UV51_C0007G0030 [Candidatus Woesebacteria bacterium GW2011_GWC1_42_9]